MTLTMGDGGWEDTCLRLAKDPKTTGTFAANTSFHHAEITFKELDTPSTWLYNRHILIGFGSANRVLLCGYDYWSGKKINGLFMSPNVGAVYSNIDWNVTKSIVFSSGYANGDVDTSNQWVNGVNMPCDGDDVILGRNIGLQTYGGYQANCNLYCVRLYNHSLTAEEIAHNYEIDKARFNLP